MFLEVCPHCGVKVKANRLEKHVSKRHTNPRPKTNAPNDRSRSSVPFIVSSPPLYSLDDYGKSGHWW
jgi:hypothetical protein